MVKSETYYKLVKLFVESVYNDKTLTEQVSVVKDFSSQEKHMFDTIQKHFKYILDENSTTVYSIHEEADNVGSYGTVEVDASTFFDASNIFLVLKMQYGTFVETQQDRIKRTTTETEYSPYYRIGLLRKELHKNSQNLFKQLTDTLGKRSTNSSDKIEEVFKNMFKSGFEVIKDKELLKEIAQLGDDDHFGIISSEGGWFHLVKFNYSDEPKLGYSKNPIFSKWF